MKARIKATGEIVEVTRIVDRYVMTHHPHTITFEKDELDFDIEDDPDYWTRLEHTYEGMAMQVLMTDPALINVYREDEKIAMKSFVEAAVDICYDFSHALIQKLKEKEERK